MKNVKINSIESERHEADRKIFGSFIEDIEHCMNGGVIDAGSPLSDASGIRRDVRDKVKELGPTVLRFPGGTVMGIYHWQDFTGPVAKRKKTMNIVWGGRMTHEFGTAEFVSYCREVGAEPMICVNMPTGSAEEAAHWVEYCNGTGDSYYANLRRSHGYAEPFGVKYWCIGNESYAEPDLGTQHDLKVYIRDAWEFTKYMKMTDPSIELVYVGYDEPWNRAVLDALGPVCDYLSVHFYAAGEKCFEQTARFEKNTLEPVEKLLQEYNARPLVLNRWYRVPGRSHDIKIALDEWNIWNSAESSRSKYGLYQVYNWRDALWTASFLNMMLRHGKSIGIANLAQLVNVIAPIMAEKDGSWKQTTFYPFSMMRLSCGNICMGSSADDPEVDVSLTEKDGKKVIAAVNRSCESVVYELPFEASRGTILTAGSPEDHGGPDRDPVEIREVWGAGRKITVPGSSIALIRE